MKRNGLGLGLGLFWVCLLSPAVCFSGNKSMHGSGNTYLEEDKTLVFAPPYKSPGYMLSHFIHHITSKWHLSAYTAIAHNVVTGYVNPTDALETMKYAALGQSPDAKQILDVERPLLVLAGFGGLVGLVVFTCGLIICTCRVCCQRCGGRLMLVKTKPEKQRNIYTIMAIFIFCLLFFFIGAVSLYTVTPRLSQSGNKLRRVAEYAVEESKLFKYDFFKNIERTGHDDMQFTIDVMNNLLENFGAEVSVPLVNATSPLVQYLLANLSLIQNDSTTLNTIMTDLQSARQQLVSSSQSLQTDLVAMKTALGLAQTSCQSDVLVVDKTVCSGLPDANNVPTAYDFAQVSSFGGEAFFLEESNKLDYKGLENVTNSLSTRITSTIKTDTENVTKALQAELSNIPTIPQYSMDHLERHFDNLSSVLKLYEQLLDDGMESAEAHVNSLSETFQGLTFLGFLILGTGAAGVVIVFLDFQRQRKDPTLQRDTRDEHSTLKRYGRFSMTGFLGLTFTCCAIFFLGGSITFVVAANLTGACPPLEDLSLIDQIVDEPKLLGQINPLGHILFDNSSLVVSVKDMLVDCRNGSSVFEALILNRFIDIDQMVNITGHLPDFTVLRTATQNALTWVELLDASAKAEIGRLMNPMAAASNPYIVSNLTTELNALNVAPLTTALEAAATTLTPLSPSLSQHFTDMAQKSLTIDTARRTEIYQNILRLDEQIQLKDKEMQTMLKEANFVIRTSDDFRLYALGPGISLALEVVTEFDNKVTDLARQYMDHVYSNLDGGIGKCHFLWDIYNAATSVVCTWFLDSFNGLWLSLYLMAVTTIPLSVLGLKLYQQLSPLRSPKYLENHLFNLQHFRAPGQSTAVRGNKNTNENPAVPGVATNRATEYPVRGKSPVR